MVIVGFALARLHICGRLLRPSSHDIHLHIERHIREATVFWYILQSLHSFFSQIHPEAWGNLIVNCFIFFQLCLPGRIVSYSELWSRG